MAGTDYWASFVAALARSRPAASATGGGATGGTRHRRRRAEAAERRAGIFYVSPCERYTFAHPQETGHTTCPFHAVWCCGGWHTERQQPSKKKNADERTRAHFTLCTVCVCVSGLK